MLTSTSTPPVGLSSHCEGISKHGAGCPAILWAGIQEAITVGCLNPRGHGSLKSRRTWTVVGRRLCDDEYDDEEAEEEWKRRFR